MLLKYTNADRGIVEAPLLAPHLGFHVLESGVVILRSENFHTAIEGACLPDLLPLLDGRLTRREITSRLRERAGHSAFDIQTTLVSLASSGYIVSAEFSMSRETAAFWTSQGASPLWVEKRLASTPVSVSGDNGLLSRLLEEMGVYLASDNPGLSVVVCEDYLEAGNAGINRRQIRLAAPWTLVRPLGIQPMFGPVFGSGDGGPCWECLAYRLRVNREVGTFLQKFGGVLATPMVDAPVFANAARGLAAVEIAKWVVFGESAALREHALTLEPSTLAAERHPVSRRPQCRACGDPSLSRSDRAAKPVELSFSPKIARNSGGARSVTAEETLSRFRRLVSPVSGIVTRLDRVRSFADAWLHVYTSHSNTHGNADSFDDLSGSVRGRSAGKGSTAPQAEASALCEAVERYSFTFRGDEIQCRKRFADFLDAGADEAIHPNEVELFSERQFDLAERGQVAVESQACKVPARFDIEAEISWSPVWSLTRSRHRYLPTSLLYRGMPQGGAGSNWDAHSNGCAAGNTLEEAVLQGFLELVERDSVAVWWYNRLRRPAVRIESLGDEYLADAEARYREFGREFWMLDLTGDLGIPCFAAVSRRAEGPEERILYGFGAHLEPRIAALRAVCEMNQVLPLFHDSGSLDPDAEKAWLGRWLREAGIADHPYLVPDPARAPRGYAGEAVAGGDVRDDIERCRSLVEEKGLEVLVLDLTRPDIGMPVARVIVPGLRHFWRRFAPGRLYDVPVELGLAENPVAEIDLNPFIVAG